MEHIPIRPPGPKKHTPPAERARIAAEEGKRYKPGIYDFFGPTLLQKEIAKNVHREKDTLSDQEESVENKTTGNAD